MLTGVLGLSPELGALLAGFLLAGTPFKHQLSGQIGPMRDLFMAIFFTAVGLGLNLSIVLDLWWVVLLGVVAVMAVKSLTIGLSAWLLGAPPIVAGVVAVSLAQAGEFSLVIAGVAADQNLFGEDTDRVIAVIIGIVFVSLLGTPSMIAHAKYIAGFSVFMPRTPLRKAVIGSSGGESSSEQQDTRKRVVIAGFGPVGRVVADRGVVWRGAVERADRYVCAAGLRVCGRHASVLGGRAVERAGVAADQAHAACDDGAHERGARRSCAQGPRCRRDQRQRCAAEGARSLGVPHVTITVRAREERPLGHGLFLRSGP